MDDALTSAGRNERYMDKDNKPLDLVRVKSIIDNFDFGYVVGRAIKTGMPPQVAPQALAEFKEFLFAHAAHPNIPLVPQSCWCDELWHEFIVADTRAYFHFCEAAFGHYLHHDGVNTTASERAGYRAQSVKILGEAAASYGGEDLPVTCGILPPVMCRPLVEYEAFLSVQPLTCRSDRVAS
jgi:hypothetical protein